MAIKQARGGADWHRWPDDLRLRRDSALQGARRELADGIDHQQFVQFLFFRQWDNLRKFAATHRVRLIGDMPIFVSGDSADVWANPHLFLLDQKRFPTVVAGVPPDYFMKTGQKWGNPHYDWDVHRKTGFSWWIARAKAMLAQVDVVR